MKATQRQLENLIRRIVREQEEGENELTNIFSEKGYSNIPEACKSKTDPSTGEVTSNVKLCFEEFQKANQQVMDIANALRELMDEKGIQMESRRYRRRY
jgi:hypothetical protein